MRLTFQPSGEKQNSVAVASRERVCSVRIERCLRWYRRVRTGVGVAVCEEKPRCLLQLFYVFVVSLEFFLSRAAVDGLCGFYV